MKKTVLVVDRQVAVRHMLRFALEMQGWTIHEHDDALTMFDKLQETRPDLLIMGVGSADDSCPDLAGRLCCRPDLNSLPVLLVGEESKRALWDDHAIGNCFWLNRPFRLGELHATVESMIGSRSFPGREVVLESVKTGQPGSRNV